MKKTLRRKYIVVGSALIIGFLGMLLFFSTLLRDPLVTHWNRTKMDRVTEEVIQDFEKNDWDFSKSNMDDLAFENNVSITVVDEEYHLLATTRTTESELSKRMRGILEDGGREFLQSGEVFYSSLEEETRGTYFVLASRLADRGYMLVKKSVNGFKSSLRVMEICFVISTVITMICGILVLIYLSGKMTKPVKEISRITGQIANLDFGEKAEISGGDELGELADSVNLMSDRLEASMKELQEDVERRKMLVRNMGHELKTPTAVIMGYAENMPYIAREQPEKIQKYCSVISQECERMDGLIRRMLEFSTYEMGEDTLHKQFFKSGDMLAALRKYVGNEFPGRKGGYRDEDRTSGSIYGDYEVLLRAVYNYIENAVSYGKKDGLIRLCIREDEAYVYFSVFNQGEPVSPEEQEKIWDVFYKVNPARTRDKQSYGIGLSIVKQAAEAHGGSVRVRNVDDGVEFSFSVKK